MKSFRYKLLPFFLMPFFGIAVTASPITVTNASFETLPASGLSNACGGACAYSTGAVPGWTTSGNTGQWTTGGVNGNPNASNGSVLAYIDGGSLTQDVGPAVSGTTYTLQVDLLHRADAPATGTVFIEIGGAVVATATGADFGAGTWSTWTAAYTAKAGDAGKTLSIVLSSSGVQGDFDNVRLDGTTALSSVPEPGTFALLALLAPGAALLRRRTRQN